MLPTNAVEAARQVLLPYLRNAAVVIDATAGNGKDTVFLAAHTPSNARVWAFDIQPVALEATRRQLDEAALLFKVCLVEDSHERIGAYIDQPVDAAMFNLGYLPGGRHDIVTQPQTTLTAVGQTAELLQPGGMLTIVTYPGHKSGRQEDEAISAMLSRLPQKRYSVACWQMINQINNPPVLYAVERRRELRR